MKLYIIRHGETDWNAKKLLQGGAETSLNENGRYLARVTGEALKDIHFHKVFSSPLGRAMETARIVLGEREIEIISEPRIREISFGNWEGKCYHPERSEVDREMIYAFFHDTEKYKAPSNGESFDDILRRTKDFYDELIHNEQLENSNILISSHGCAVRALEQNIDSKCNFWRNGVPKNCAVTIVELKHGDVVSVEWDHIYYKL